MNRKNFNKLRKRMSEERSAGNEAAARLILAAIASCDEKPIDETDAARSDAHRKTRDEQRPGRAAKKHNRPAEIRGAVVQFANFNASRRIAASHRSLLSPD